MVDRGTGPRLLALDGLRGLAAITVIVWHVLDVVEHHVVAPESAASPLIADSGKYAVSLFFVLSGFLLARPLLAWLLGQRERPRLRRYMRARLLRILPAWLVVLAVVVPIARPDLLLAPADLLQLSTLTYMSFDPMSVRYVVPQSWTLTVEIAVYLALPLLALASAPIVLRLRASWRAPVLAAALGAVIVASLVWQHVLYDITGRPLADMRPINHLVPVFAGHFALGGLVALAVLVQRGPSARLAAGLGTAAFLAGGLLVVEVQALRPESRALVASGLALFVLAAATARSSRLAGVLATAPAVYAGQRSYAVYLWHYPLLQAALAVGLVSTGTSPLLVLVLLTAASFAVAEVSWRLVEARALALVDRPRPEARPAAHRRAPVPPSRRMAHHASLDRAPAR